jgi:hypothetical protein
MKGVVHFFLGLVVGSDDATQRATAPARGAAQPPAAPAALTLAPIVLAAQEPDLDAACEDFAGVALQLGEAGKMGQSEVEAEPASVREQVVEPGKGKKEKPPVKVAKTADIPEICLFRKQGGARIADQTISPLEQVQGRSSFPCCVSHTGHSLNSHGRDAFGARGELPPILEQQSFQA